MMAALAGEEDCPAARLAHRDANGLDVDLGSLAAAETEWRAFEVEALASPYQRFDWVAAYAGAMEDDGAIRVVRVRAGGRLVALMAVRRERRFGLRVATPIGRKHANLHQPLVDPRFLAGAGRQGMRAVLAAVGRRAGADVLSLPSCPASWVGLPNPLAAGAVRSASDAYGLTLGRDAEAVLMRVSSTHARKKLRSKERGLAKLGAVSVARAASAVEVAAVLDAFFAQKRRRFEALGIDDPYAGADAQAFVRAGSLARLDDGRPPIELYALRLDDRVVAVLGGAADRRRFSGMFISFETDGPEARHSPGEILVAQVIAEQCRLGRAAFDLGIGEARYKRTFCDETLDLVDLVVPTTLAGRLYCAGARPALAAKRRLKQSAWFMRALAAARRLKATAGRG